jgi:hypothetical protein
VLSPEDRRWIHERAYVPEHLPDYVEAVSGTEGHLTGSYLCFTGRDHLVLVGYALGPADESPEEAFSRACDRFEPAAASLLAPEVRLTGEGVERAAADRYHRLPLPLEPVPPEAAYMVRRARRELRVTEGAFGRAHRGIVKAFLTGRDLSPEQRRIFERIPKYLSRSRTARLLEARRGKKLAAFDILDLGSARYAFYLFNFRAPGVNVPGASDLLLREMAELAGKEGRTALNLGLGVNAGVRRFKEKWGGEPFLPYASATVRRKETGVASLLKKL